MELTTLLERFRADPLTLFSADEAVILNAAAETDIVAAKASAAHAARAGNHQAVLDLSRRIAREERSPKALLNVAIALRRLGRFKDALEWVCDNLEDMDPLEAAGFLAAVSSYVGDEEGARRWGNESLRLRDVAARPLPAREPVVHFYDPNRPAQNIVSFSLWGSDPRYISGALANQRVIPYLYPGWTARFYVDASVPADVLSALAGSGAQIVRVENLPAERYGMFWRMLVEDDPSVAIYVIRDADAVVNAKERWAVADWLNAGTAFHVMRDHPTHCELMLGGMWGAHRGNIGDIGRRFMAFAREPARAANRAYDQEFLRREIWPLARHSVTQHDSCFDLMDPRRYDAGFALPATMHIGQNEWARRADGGRPSGSVRTNTKLSRSAKG